MTNAERGSEGQFLAISYPNARVRVGKAEWVPLLPLLPRRDAESALNSEGR